MKFHPLTWLILVGAIALLGWLWLKSARHPLAVNDVSSVVVTNATTALFAPAVKPVENPAGTMASVTPVSVPTQAVVAVTGTTAALATNDNPPAEIDPMDAKLKLAELWQSTNRLETVKAIAPYLTNADAEVRSMAIESMKQVGDHDTAKMLQALADVVTNDADRKALNDAAMFLYLPTLTDRLEGQPRNAYFPRQSKPVPRPPIMPRPDSRPSDPLVPDGQPTDP